MTDRTAPAPEREVGWDYISACHLGALPLSARNLEIVRNWRLAGGALGQGGPRWAEVQRMLEAVATTPAPERG